MFEKLFFLKMIVGTFQTIFKQLFSHIFHILKLSIFLGIHSSHANKFLYQKVHKIHHLHSAPFAITADYAHWFEEIFVNVFPQ